MAAAAVAAVRLHARAIGIVLGIAAMLAAIPLAGFDVAPATFMATSFFGMIDFHWGSLHSHPCA
jgi:hypothetical protein